MIETPAWAAQQVTLPLWVVLVLAAYSNRRIVEMLRNAKGQLPSRRPKTDSKGGE